MAMIIGSDGADREQPNPGLVRGLCIGVHDIGWQVGFQGAIVKQVLFSWEIDQRLSRGEHAGKRHLVSQRFKQSMHEKAALSKTLESWTGHKFTEDERQAHDVEAYRERPCMLNLQASKDGKYINVAGVLPMMAGMEALKRETPQDYTPEWILKKIEEGRSKPAVEGQGELASTWTPEAEGPNPTDPLEARRQAARETFRSLMASGFFPPERMDEMKKLVADNKENLPSIEHLVKAWQGERDAGSADLDKAIF